MQRLEDLIFKAGRDDEYQVDLNFVTDFWL